VIPQEKKLKIVRFNHRGRGKYGILDGDVIRGLRGNPFTGNKGAGFSPVHDGSSYEAGGISLLPPCVPSKIICLGINYRNHSEETGLPVPEVPLIFMKPSTAVIGPDGTIVLPRSSRRVDYEGELGVVIGRRAKDVLPGSVNDHILGYTCFNDVSERHNQKADGQWTRAKGYDTFAPAGPCIETDLSPDNLKLETFLNGELRQSASTSDLIFGIPELIRFISGVMTLLPGDIIATGTPSGIGKMKAGDEVVVSIEGIGKLRNYVASAA
jgi:2-keto-4-pentenoate hydratase/2-oxohepta-3-ene-1,7-dioic acid hydratase in catechol pathway